MADAAKPVLLEAREVTVRFGGLVAVDAVSASFRAGELVVELRLNIPVIKNNI